MPPNNKIVSLEKLKEIVFKLKSQKKKIVTTNGVFDILHIGHIRYLGKARELGDCLIVGLNSDSSVKRLKGESRPINNQNDRAEVLSALEFVNYVLIFEDDIPIKWLNVLKPDIHVKGGDYSLDKMIEKEVVEKNKGMIIILDKVHGVSTTNIIERLKASEEV